MQGNWGSTRLHLSIACVVFTARQCSMRLGSVLKGECKGSVLQ